MQLYLADVIIAARYLYQCRQHLENIITEIQIRQRESQHHGKFVNNIRLNCIDSFYLTVTNKWTHRSLMSDLMMVVHKATSAL